MQPALTNQLNNAFTLFLSLLVEAIPFLLLGVLFSGLLLGFVDERLPRIPHPGKPAAGGFDGQFDRIFVSRVRVRERAGGSQVADAGSARTDGDRLL